MQFLDVARLLLAPWLPASACFNLLLTCRDLRDLVDVWRRKGLLLKRVVSHLAGVLGEERVPAFVSTLQKFDSLMSGSFVLHALEQPARDPAWSYGDIDIFCPSRYVRDLLNDLEKLCPDVTVIEDDYVHPQRVVSSSSWSSKMQVISCSDPLTRIVNEFDLEFIKSHFGGRGLRLGPVHSIRTLSSPYVPLPFVSLRRIHKYRDRGFTITNFMVKFVRFGGAWLRLFQLDGDKIQWCIQVADVPRALVIDCEHCTAKADTLSPRSWTKWAPLDEVIDAFDYDHIPGCVSYRWRQFLLERGDPVFT